MVHTFCDCVSFYTLKLFIRIIQVVISVRFQFSYWVLYVRATFNLLYFRPAIGVNACVSALLATRLSMFLCPVQFVDLVFFFRSRFPRSLLLCDNNFNLCPSLVVKYSQHNINSSQVFFFFERWLLNP